MLQTIINCINLKNNKVTTLIAEDFNLKTQEVDEVFKNLNFTRLIQTQF